MYRIELSPGEETAFRTIEELAVAIRRGIVTPRARVWHNASGKWLPIHVHPHYKAAAAMQLTPADLAAGPPVKPLELLSLGAAMDPRPQPAPPPLSRPAEEPEPLPRGKRTSKRTSELQEPREAREPREEMPRKKPVAKSRRPRSGGRSIRLALIGALLIGCGHLALSAASAIRSNHFVVGTLSPRRLVTVTANIPQQSGPETTAAAVLPGLSDVPSAALRVNSAPAITKSEAATPPINAFRADSEPTIQPAPDSVTIAAPLPPPSDPISRKTVDSTDKKAMKKILRSISGTADPSRPRR
jgi:hypothetical protein